MTFLPIVERELRVTSRRRGTYWMRVATAAVAIAIWFILSVAGSRFGSPAQRAHLIFNAIGVIGLGFSLLAGVFLTADCLSEEKRERTLGLLFLTDLKGYDVVFGKLVSTSLHAFYGLLTILPLLALPMLMGGVTAGEFWRVTLVLIATLALSLSTGMIISALSRETRQAMTGTLLTLLTLTGILPVLWWLQTIVSKMPLFDPLLWPSPVYTYVRAFDASYRIRQGPHEFWTSLLVVICLSAGALIVASVLLPRSWQEKSASSGPSEKTDWRRRFRFGSAKWRNARRRLLEENPFYWLATRDRLPRRMALTILFGLVAIWLCFFVGCFSRKGSMYQVSFTVTVFMAYGLHQVVKCLIAVEASRRLSEDKHSGALELLLVTPLNLKRILLGQRRALGDSFRSSILTVIAVNLALIWLIAWPNPIGIRGRDAWPFYELFIGGIIIALTDCYALGWVGMWMALRTQRHHRAVFGTLGRVMLLPWLAIVFIVCLGFMGAFGGGPDEVGVLFGWWLVLGFFNDLIVALWAQTQLSRRFRQSMRSLPIHVTLCWSNPPR